MNSSPFDTLQILIPDIEKQAFKKACKFNGTTMTRELRRFIYEYCRTADRPDMSVYESWLNDH